MIANHQFGACLPTFGNCADRYCLSGYGGGGKTMEAMLDLALKVKGLDGLELVGNWHVNDNYRSWDDDMMVGAIHLVEYLELLYWLKRLKYNGWLTLDIFPYREDGVRAATQCREWLVALFKAVDRVGLEKFTAVIRSADATEATALVRRAIMGC